MELGRLCFFGGFRLRNMPSKPEQLLELTMPRPGVSNMGSLPDRVLKAPGLSESPSSETRGDWRGTVSLVGETIVLPVEPREGLNPWQPVSSGPQGCRGTFLHHECDRVTSALSGSSLGILLTLHR